jgi:hypothetical protein
MCRIERVILSEAETSQPKKGEDKKTTKAARGSTQHPSGWTHSKYAGGAIRHIST